MAPARVAPGNGDFRRGGRAAPQNGGAHGGPGPGPGPGPSPDSGPAAAGGGRVRPEPGSGGRAAAAARRRALPGVHARGHPRHGQGHHGGAAGGARLPHLPGQHLPPRDAARPRAGAAGRRPARLHGLGPQPADGQRRLPDGLPGGALGGDRGRRPLPLALRRRRAPAEPRALHPHPERAGCRYHHAAGRRGQQHHHGAARRGGHAQVRPLAGSLHRRQPAPGAAEPLRHHPGGAGPGPAQAVPGRDDAPRRPRLRHRRPERRRGEGAVLAHGEAQHRPPAPRQTPLPDGRGLRHRPGGLRRPGLRHVRLRLPHADGAFRLGPGALGLAAAEEQAVRQGFPPHRRAVRLPDVPPAQPRVPARVAPQRPGRPAPPHRAQHRLPARPDAGHAGEHRGAALPRLRAGFRARPLRGPRALPPLGPARAGSRRHHPGLRGLRPPPVLFRIWGFYIIFVFVFLYYERVSFWFFSGFGGTEMGRGGHKWVRGAHMGLGGHKWVRGAQRGRGGHRWV